MNAYLYTRSEIKMLAYNYFYCCSQKEKNKNNKRSIFHMRQPFILRNKSYTDISVISNKYT